MVDFAPGDHLCPLSEGKKEQMQVLSRFVGAALQRGERFVVFSRAEDVEALFPSLRVLGVDAAREQRRGALEFMTDRDTVARGGVYSPDAFMEMLERQAGAAPQDGFTGLGFASVNWRENISLDKMIATEAHMDELLERYRLSLICLYDRTVLDPEFVHDLLRVHPRVVVREQRLSNPYFEPPENLLNPVPESIRDFKRKRVAWWIERIEAVAAEEVERERLLMRLRQAQRMESLSRLAGGISHDFNNLLTTISGFTDLLSSELEVGTPAREYADEVQDAAQRSARLTEQLLTFSQKQVVHARPIDVRQVVERMHSRLERAMHDGVDLLVSTGNEPATTLADPAQVEQMIMNLAINACEAMQEDGGTVKVAVEERTLDEPLQIEETDLAEGPYIVISVSDTGPGIPREALPFIYDPFFTTRAKKRGGGLGLGLATVYGIVQQSSGAIHLETSTGRGTTFSVFLPAIEAAGDGDGEGAILPETARAAPEAEPSGPEAEIPRRGPGHHPLSEALARARARSRQDRTILLVVPQDAVRGLLSNLLPRFGYQVLEATDAPTALELFEEHQDQVDLVLMDAFMPVMDSTELSARIRAGRQDLPVVFMVGYADDIPPREEGVNATTILKKPFRGDDLDRTLRDALAASEDGDSED